MDRILPKLLAVITRRPRSKVVAGIDFEWSKKSWTYNVFRVYELLFWRGCSSKDPGDTIRFESSTKVVRDPISQELIVSRVFGTKEARIAHWETCIRAYFQSWKLSFKWIPLPVLMPVDAYTPQQPIFMLAIAQDTSTQAKDNSGAVTFVSATHTTTGSNMLMAGHGGLLDGTANNAAVTSLTYNSITVTGQQTAVGSGGADQATAYLASLIAPTSGGNTAQLNVNKALTASLQLSEETVTYSGCKQSGQPDSSNKFSSTSDSASTITVATTVVASNCWLAGSFTDPDLTTVIAPTTQVNSTMFNHRACDSNGTVATGSQSLGWNRSGTFAVGATNMSIAPFIAAATVTQHFLPMIGAGS